MRYWSLREWRDLHDAHLAGKLTPSSVTVKALCGAEFWPSAVFNSGSAAPSTPPGPRVCAACPAAQ